MQTIFFSASLWLLTGLLLSHADNTNNPRPTPPFVAPVPANAQWTLALTYGDGDSKTGATAKIPRRLQEITAVKTGKTKHDTFVYSDQSQEEYWYVDPYILEPESFDKNAIDLLQFSDGGFGARGSAQYGTGFTGINWINAPDFDKTVSYEGQMCYHFVHTSESGLEAWIRVKDKMPVAYRMDGILYVYTFGNPPSSPLVLPPAYATVLRNYLELQQRRSQLEQAFNHH
jgi:hypothetical protein